MSTDNIAPADPASPPTSKDYAAAFYELEDKILEISRHSKLANYLISLVSFHFENKKQGSAEVVAGFATGLMEDLNQEIADLDQSYLDKHNDLVGRENLLRGFSG